MQTTDTPAARKNLVLLRGILTFVSRTSASEVSRRIAERESIRRNLNTHYIVLFKNPRDAVQVSTLARQMYPGKSKFVVEAYEDATKEPYGYLLIDLKPETDDSYRIRTRIFPDDDRQYAYVSKV
jgi:hypothetical protein